VKKQSVSRERGIFKIVMICISFIFVTITTAYSAQIAVSANVAPDFSSGAYSVIHFDSSYQNITAQNNLLPTISDITVKAYGESFYPIERYKRDNMAKFGIKDPSGNIWQYSVGDGSSNVHDMIFVSNQKAYLLRYGKDKIWIVNPSATTEDQFKIGEIDLSTYADADGIPEMESGLIVGNKLFVLLQRLDRNNNWAPQVSYMAVIDTTADTEIDTGIQNDLNVKGISLPIKNVHSIKYLDGRIYIQGIGRYASSYSDISAEYTGGIAVMDPDTYEVSMLVDDGNDTVHPYGNITDMAVDSQTKGYFIGYNGWGDDTLYAFNPSSGAVTGAVVDLMDKNLSCLAVDKNGYLWVGDSTDAEIVIVNPADNSIVANVNTDLNPTSIAFAETPPKAPVLKIQENGSNVAFSWNSVSDADGYRLYFAPYPYPWGYIASIDMGKMADTSLRFFLGNKAFYIAIRPYNTAGEGALSNIEILR